MSNPIDQDRVTSTDKVMPHPARLEAGKYSRDIHHATIDLWWTQLDGYWRHRAAVGESYQMYIQEAYDHADTVERYGPEYAPPRPPALVIGWHSFRERIEWLRDEESRVISERNRKERAAR